MFSAGGYLFKSVFAGMRNRLQLRLLLPFTRRQSAVQPPNTDPTPVVQCTNSEMIGNMIVSDSYTNADTSQMPFGSSDSPQESALEQNISVSFDVTGSNHGSQSNSPERAMEVTEVEDVDVEVVDDPPGGSMSSHGSKRKSDSPTDSHTSCKRAKLNAGSLRVVENEVPTGEPDFSDPNLKRSSGIGNGDHYLHPNLLGRLNDQNNEALPTPTYHGEPPSSSNREYMPDSIPMNVSSVSSIVSNNQVVFTHESKNSQISDGHDSEVNGNSILSDTAMRINRVLESHAHFANQKNSPAPLSMTTSEVNINETTEPILHFKQEVIDSGENFLSTDIGDIFRDTDSGGSFTVTDSQFPINIEFIKREPPELQESFSPQIDTVDEYLFQHSGLNLESEATDEHFGHMHERYRHDDGMHAMRGSNQSEQIESSSPGNSMDHSMVLTAETPAAGIATFSRGRPVGCKNKKYTQWKTYNTRLQVKKEDEEEHESERKE